MSTMKIGKKQLIGTMKIVTGIQDLFEPEESEEMGRKKMSKKISNLLITGKPYEIKEAFEILSQMYIIVSHPHYVTLSNCVAATGVNTLRGIELAGITVDTQKAKKDIFVIERDDYKVIDEVDEDETPKMKTILIDKSKVNPKKEKMTTRIGNFKERHSRVMKSNLIELTLKTKYKLGLAL